MAALPIIEPFQIFEDRCLGLLPILKPSVMDQVGF